nr:PREDICTED: brain and acute leukemia cytoplasmic protein [Latimeria chalumnae]|eukprot:XP_014353111.1 PREDICTED: brain and acute leukemia cytoplasmic protein [Latimeria chalumnae]
MGCGGSRADAIEPRYYESWTRDTESTWLTNTDTETQVPVNSNGCQENGNESNGKEKGTIYSVIGGEGGNFIPVYCLQDVLHPNPEGLLAMAPLTECAPKVEMPNLDHSASGDTSYTNLTMPSDRPSWSQGPKILVGYGKPLEKGLGYPKPL